MEEFARNIRCADCPNIISRSEANRALRGFKYHVGTLEPGEEKVITLAYRCKDHTGKIEVYGKE